MPFALVAVIVLGETASLRTRRDAEQKDRGSYRVFRGSLALGYLAAFSLRQRGSLPETLAFGAWAAWAGAVITVAGTALRVWSMRTLGDYFTRVVHVSPDQKVVESGPYRLLRHPSYTGAALAALGVGLSMGNVVTLLLIVLPFVIGVSYRIRVEERALAETIGEPYRAYMKRTKRLIPYVF
jgi:protein-S-isoprenylcysteine O-methyltransferase Ste14